MKFIHTADWQIGKPFARIVDQRKRVLAQQARFSAVERIGEVAREEDAYFVVVAGDLFDSPRVDRPTVSAACAAIGRIEIPVIAIPGNHDHAGPGSIWEQEYFLYEQKQLAPNLVVLTEPGAYRMESALILACPLQVRTSWTDPTEWLWSAGVAHEESSVPRIVLVHGSTQVFTGICEDEDEPNRGTTSGTIDLEKLAASSIDYVALGDWHGTKQVGPNAWYSGTPEPDRFAKAGEYDSGNVLVVDIEPGGPCQVRRVGTGRLRWANLNLNVSGDSGAQRAIGQIADAVGGGVDEALLNLTLTGTISIETAGRLKQELDSQEARLLRLKLINQTVIEPTEDELQSLLASEPHPLVASVAARLLEMAAGNDDDAQIARVALRDLYVSVERSAAACSGEVGRPACGTAGGLFEVSA